MSINLLSKLQKIKRQILPDEKVLLFGSRARGDAREDSDWDLLILLNKQKQERSDMDKYGYPFTEMGWKYGQYVSTKLYTVDEWKRRKNTPFYNNVEKEGIEIK